MVLQVQDTSASPTLSRLLTAGLNRGSSIKSDRSSNSSELSSNTVGVDNLCAEMNTLMHDFEVVSRIADLVSTLRGSYKVGHEVSSLVSCNYLASFNVDLLLCLHVTKYCWKCSDQGIYDGQDMQHACPEGLGREVSYEEDVTNLPLGTNW